jgi:Aerotolerance regulator N-terminal/von Willebrand factor type A domain
MSFLAPLYFLGLSAVVAPIVFHLIRRSPKGEVPFSSLMFLTATPPRLTRRSRLDNWLLLALRVTALCLLAFAFARPFLREAARLNFADMEERRIALLIDTSASMRRGDLWPRARALARQVLDDCRPTDQLAVFAFDRTFRPLLGFHESATLDPARRKAIARAAVDRLTPTWAGTNLGQALVDTVAAVEDNADTSEKASRMPRRIVLFSDFSQGSRLEALGDFEWPSDVELDNKTVANTGSNAGLERLADQIEGEPADSAAARRVRVANNPGSMREKFELTWVDTAGVASAKTVDVYVPPGESRVVRMPRPGPSVSKSSLRLSGDAAEFDNSLYFADELRREVTVRYIGTDRGDDPQGLFYYLERVFVDNPEQRVHITAHKPSEVLDWSSKNEPQLVIITAETPANVTGIEQFIRRGGTVLYVAGAAGRAETLAALAGVSPWNIEEAAVNRDVMLGEIAFDHPLFTALAAPQFNDFTKIRFFKYRRIDDGKLGGSRVLARFENNDPALIEKPLGKGKLVVLASGWQRVDSQLARSSKFVPLMLALIEPGGPRGVNTVNHRVGDRVPLPPLDSDVKNVTVKKPDGASVTIAASTAYFDETDQPGVYTIDAPSGASSFAVNLDPLESKTAPLAVETIEQFGVRLANHTAKGVDHDERRQMYNTELEGRQQLWRWLILAVIGILIFETWLAGRTVDRPGPARAEALTT